MAAPAIVQRYSTSHIEQCKGESLKRFSPLNGISEWKRQSKVGLKLRFPLFGWAMGIFVGIRLTLHDQCREIFIVLRWPLSTNTDCMQGTVRQKILNQVSFDRYDQTRFDRLLYSVRPPLDLLWEGGSLRSRVREKNSNIVRTHF